MTNFWQKLKKPITALAPMYDVTDFVFREIVATTAKPDVMFTEFVCTDAFFTKGHDKVLRDLKFSQEQRPIVAQIWGPVPENYTKAAKFINELGFDGIDINMGCPDKDVMKNGSGAALINNPSLAEKIIKAVRKGAPKLPLSIKTRLGRDADLSKDWFSFLLSQNINVVTIHGRDTKSKSNGPVHWDEIAKAVKLRDRINPKVLVIGNGDVKSYQESCEKSNEYGVDGVMLGRGIFENPWVFEKTKTPTQHSIRENTELLIKHTKLFNDTWGKTKNFELMKKFFKVYVRGFKGADELRAKLMEVRNYEDLRKCLALC